ncbi:hypothetical protein GDO78_014544, partial [Eleutherodactylus coqui]
SSQGFQISQSPKLLIRRTGELVELHCQHNDNTYHVMSWYQQKPQQGLRLMVYSPSADAGADNMETGFNTWSFKRTETTSSNLSLPQSTAQHSAVYFCAASKHSHISQCRCEHNTCSVHSRLCP